MFKWIRKLFTPSIKDMGIIAFRQAFESYKDSINIPANITERNTTKTSVTQRFNRCLREYHCADKSFASIDGMLQFMNAKLILQLKYKLYGAAFCTALECMIMYFNITRIITKLNKEDKKDETSLKVYKDGQGES